mmetsp:Transcript_33745/g.61138  ORF Transcript_33745/g.61138 Transcript_33745/m.61138 type:complete len:486 (+) Transcript_33745:36-1493(+)
MGSGASSSKKKVAPVEPEEEPVKQPRLRRCVLLVDGSRADVEPFLALAMKLRKAKIDISFITGEAQRFYVSQFGFRCEGVLGDMQQILADKEAVLKAYSDGPVAFAKYVWGPSYANAWAALDKLQPDFIIYNITTLFIAGAWAEANMTPAIPIFQQLIVATGEYYPFRLETQGDCMSGWREFFRAWIARGHLELVKEAMTSKHSSVSTPHRLRMMDWESEEAFLQFFADPNQPMIFAVSQLMTGRPSEYTDHHHLVGFIPTPTPFTGANPESKLGLDVRQAGLFLEGGSAPVSFGWGRMSSQLDMRDVTVKVITALKDMNLRGIILTGSVSIDITAFENKELVEYAKENVLLASSLPHDWLFPQCSCIVHHGGCGTTAENFRAGRPGVITPIMLDQLDWARWVQQSGVGVVVGHPGRISAAVLAAAVQHCLKDEELCHRAADLRDRLKDENGAEKAASVIRDFIDGPMKSGEWLEKQKQKLSELT